MEKIKLPVADFRDQILSSVAGNAVTIITAETGAGKSTQVPQYLLDAGYDIVVTQPRRLAARTVAERVAEEIGCEFGTTVGFRTAHDRCDSEGTRCLFVTDGLAMVRELMGAGHHDVLVLDEVHEWNLNMETLVAWAKVQVSKSQNFKLVLMSATLEAEALSGFFDGAQVIKVPGRLFPVESRKPAEKLVDDIAKLVAEGRNVLCFQPGKAEIEATISALQRAQVVAEVMPLHGELTSAEQKKCFAHYGRPKVVVSTNVAQTSVTIDDIDAVVDSGMERRVELVNGVEGLYIRAISQADAKQRAGRAGRTKPGVYIDHCGESDRRDFPVAEIERVRLDQTVLRLAIAGFDMEELRFFHHPAVSEIHAAKETLKKLGCMDAMGLVTKIGHAVSRLPISVQFGRMVVEAERLGVVGDVITAAAILESGELNTRKDKDGNPSDEWRKLTGGEQGSDVIAQMRLYDAAGQMAKGALFDAGIHPKAYGRAKDLRKQIEGALESRGVDTTSSGKREDILLAICAGMVDHLYRNSYGTLVNGDSRERAKESVVSLGEWAVGLPFDLQITTRRGKMTLRLVRMLTSVTPKQLETVAPQLVERKSGLNCRFDSTRNEVVSTTEVWFSGSKVAEEVMADPDHMDATQVIVEHLYSSFSYPQVSSVAIEEGVVVPEVAEVAIGNHPETGGVLVSYSASYVSWGTLYGKWVRTRAEAEEMCARAVADVSAIFLRKQEEAKAKADKTYRCVRLRPEFEKLNQRREAVGMSTLELREESYVSGYSSYEYTDEALARIMAETDAHEAKVEAEKARRAEEERVRLAAEAEANALDNAKWGYDRAKSESNKYHGDGVVVAATGEIVPSDGEKNVSGSAFIRVLYVRIPEGSVAVSWEWNNRESTVFSASFTVHEASPEEITIGQLETLSRVEKEKGLKGGSLTELFKKPEVAKNEEPQIPHSMADKLAALQAKFGK